MTTNIIVKLQYEATHNWPGVAEALPDQPEIHFLQYPHRHIFYITVEKNVSHADRDIEIIMFKRKLLKDLESYYGGNLQNSSCEMVAERILQTYDCVSVEVLEDNENGAKVYK